MESTLKGAAGAVAIATTFAMYLPYIASIQRGEVKPHAFSWVSWGLGTLIVAAAQGAGGGGAGAWATALSGAITLYIAILAYAKRSDTSITRADTAFFVAALCTLLCWLATSDPLWAVVILTANDLLGFGPTIRHARAHPHDESVSLFFWSAMRSVISISALRTYSLTTVLFPAAVGLACLLFAGALAKWQRAATHR
jgi:hypothetical protein